MRLLLVIGLPKQLQPRLVTALRGHCVLKSVQAEIGKQGTPRLIPFPDEAVRMIGETFDELEDHSQAHVIVLSYAPLPPKLDSELAALQSSGATVTRAVPSQGQWPVLRGKRFDNPFLESLFHAIATLVIPPNAERLPSSYLQAAAARTPSLLIAKGAIDLIDSVAAHRHKFLETAIDALEAMASAACEVGPLEAHFSAKGLNLATTGGVEFTLTLSDGHSTPHRQRTNCHLKRGDKTTPTAAVRLYFDILRWNGGVYVIVLYAGPHPDEEKIERILAASDLPPPPTASRIVAPSESE